jgi:hypothetical protein
MHSHAGEEAVHGIRSGQQSHRGPTQIGAGKLAGSFPKM